MDLMGPTRTKSMGGKRYIMVVVDDFSRYSWVEFLRKKSEAYDKMERLCKRLQNEKGVPILKSEVIMGRNLKMQSLKNSAMNTASKGNFQLRKLHNRMKWLKERTG